MSFSFKEWYELNGRRLNNQRKSRYHTDPNYRNKVLQTNQESREKRKQSTTEERKAEKKAIRVRLSERKFKTVDAVIDGVSEKLFTIGALAEALGCSIQAIRLWERQSIIPPTPLRTGKGQTGDRLYTTGMVETIRTILIAQGRLKDRDVKEKQKPRPLLRFIRLANGKVVQTKLFLIGVLAKEVHRNVVTLEQLESKGILPRTPFRASSVGRRLYTGDMIATVKKAFESRGGEIRGEEAWKGFHDEILARWTAQGIIGAVLVQAAPPESEKPDDQGQGIEAEAGSHTH